MKGEEMHKLIWTKKGLEKHAKGQSDPMHTISAPNIAEVYDGFVRQMKPGTPWILVKDGEVIARG
jgi:hypothetical protein